MARSVLSLTYLGLFVAIVLLGTPVCYGSEVGEDTVFASEPSQKGVYRKTTGKIVTLTSNELIMETDGTRILYEREAIRHIVLSDDHSPREKSIADVYWNQDKSLLIKALQGTPLIGGFLSFLDNLPSGTRMFLAILVLFGLLLYAGYKLYQVLVISANLQNLNMTKINMEVIKLRYELNTIRKELGITEAMAPEQITAEAIHKAITPCRYEIPRLRLIDLVRHKILRMLTEEEKEGRSALWRRKWEVFRQKPGWRGVGFYYLQLTVNLVGTYFAFCFSAGSLFDMFLPVFEPNIEMGPLVSLIFLPVFIISLAVLLRLNSLRKIIRKTYREVYLKRD